MVKSKLHVSVKTSAATVTVYATIELSENGASKPPGPAAAFSHKILMAGIASSKLTTAVAAAFAEAIEYTIGWQRGVLSAASEMNFASSRTVYS